MGDDIAKRPYITVGMAALLCLIPLAATSTTGMVKRLGARGLAPAAPPRLRGGRPGHAALPVAGQGGSHGASTSTPPSSALLLGDPPLVCCAAGACGSWGRAPAARLAWMIGRPAGPRRCRPCAWRWRAAPGAPARGRRSGALGRPPAGGPLREVLANGVVLIAQEHRAADVVAAAALDARGRPRRERRDELGLSPLPRAHALQGHADAAARLHRPPDRGARRHQQRLHVVRLHALRRRAPGRATARRRSTSWPTSRSTPAFVPDEIEGEKKVVFEEMNVLRGRSRQVPGPPALRAGLRRPSLRPPHPRHAARTSRPSPATSSSATTRSTTCRATWCSSSWAR